MPSAYRSIPTMPETPDPMAAAELPEFRRQLLAWFRRARRDLCWRRTRDPYRIWLSEIMLQQTRVAAVTPYYRRFCARFPTVRHLARARPEAVLRQWAGLGYYRRARNLQQAARRIVARHGGTFPRTLAEALALPGIGRYTAAAVLSIAYGEPLAVLDGNVARVLARLGAVRGELRRPRIWRSLQASAGRLLARNEPGEWNQAMMELGAVLCTPRTPRCAECPVARWCRARARGLTDALPVARAKPATVRATLAAAVLVDPRGRTLLVRHDGRDGALFSHLWQFPAVPAGRNAREAIARHLTQRLGIPAPALEPLTTARHAVTRHAIRLAPFLGRIARLPPLEGARALRLAALERLPVSGATRKIAAAALRSL
jgi:A/G-specific adenine glycosylase